MAVPPLTPLKGEAVTTEVTAYIGIGANLGDPLMAVRGALEHLGWTPGLRVLRQSSMYRTAPFQASGPDFINAVAEISTTLSPPALLTAMQAIEDAAGRARPYRNAPRTLDLDLLLYGDERIDSRRLTVPHPRMHERAFVLVPLAEINPSLVPPKWLAAVADQRIERVADSA
ncbi:MAG: 2-amino-4-hydroxy-6-hydroxymethyldihydropteridine diphosphokinase [Hydrogenophaga sp.]|uniref:2-amino-4-hydroxy-6- hydroxymethyldihydropteridine diphosphokinase n=1 Tax=Hydrogenophaga sp. TaxID=1904254 RepID=UPI001DC786E4|nr:2-amino-4-hydroxy-6-hydroxymethyldihydropteridine diphosphokinase [Hydrogenophaga sp.]MBX3610347.1 2-amino-4-hydroxy-6-hydroxymethyldihydropteridine diphosphokinase [Hydrogenophaga sp.]